MDWIKVLTKHILFEYSDLKDSEFTAWVKIMALAAYLEKEPTREQMLKYVHYKTLDSLQCKLNERSIDLQYIINKVLIDVQYVANRRDALKINNQRYRERKTSVIDPVIIPLSPREDKIREDKNIIHTPLPPKGESYSQSFLDFWKAYPKKVGKESAWKAWRKRKDLPTMVFILSAIDRQKQTDQWKRGFIKDPVRWINQGCWADDPASMNGGDIGRGTGNRSAGPGTPIQARYVEEIPEPLSEAQVAANLVRVREFIG
jgi:hypothetical protein